MTSNGNGYYPGGYDGGYDGGYLANLPHQSVATQTKVRSGRWKVVIVVAVLVLLASLLALGAILASYYFGQQKYDALTEHVYTDPGSSNDPLYATVDWDALLSDNADTVGWVYIPNTDINYPVVRGKDNDYYLSHDFYGDEGWLANFGAVFMDYRDKPDWTDQAYFFYGHHMNDGSMFADIAAMADQEYFDNARTIYLYSPSGNFELRSYSLLHVDASDPLVQIMFPNADDMTEYIQNKMDRSIVNGGEMPDPQDITKSFAFSTCDNYSQGRYVLFTYIERTTVFNLEYDRQRSATPGDAQSGVSDK